MNVFLVAKGVRNAAMLEFDRKVEEKEIERLLKKVCTFCSYVGYEPTLTYTTIHLSGSTLVIVTRKEEKLIHNYLVKAVKKTDKKMIGVLLGYPICCVNNYVANPEKAVDKYIEESIRRGIGHVYEDLIFGAWYVGKMKGDKKGKYRYAFLPYVPCDPFCTLTLYKIEDMCLSMWVTLGNFIDGLGEKYEIRSLSKRKW